MGETLTNFQSAPHQESLSDPLPIVRGVGARVYYAESSKITISTFKMLLLMVDKVIENMQGDSTQNTGEMIRQIIHNLDRLSHNEL